MTQVELIPKVVPPGAVLTVRVSGYDGPTGFVDIQADCVFVQLARDRFGFSISLKVEAAEEFAVMLSVPDGAPTGAYFLAKLLVLATRHPAVSPAAPVVQRNMLDGTIDLQSLAFLVGEDVAGTEQAPAAQIQELRAQREQRIRTRIDVGDSPYAITAQVTYLYSGLLVHAPQHCEGYSILPYGDRLSPASIHMALNAFAGPALNRLFQLTPEQAVAFSSQRPLAAVVFHTIGAQNVEAAIQGVRSLVDNIAQALAFDRGYVPEPFACIVGKGPDLTMWLLHRPYTGNLLPSFGATELGLEVEKLTKAMMLSPFAKLLLKLYVQAVGDQDSMFQVFRFWSILELLAKRAVPCSHHHIINPSGECIQLSNGQLITTSKAEAKVYKYLFDQGAIGLHASAQTPNGQFTIVVEGTEPASLGPGPGLRLTFWEFIQAAYAVRNGVAHEGRFAPDAYANPGSPKELARLLLSCPLPGLLLEHLKYTARVAVSNEIHHFSEAGILSV